jgi:putative DNA primase/helicase
MTAETIARALGGHRAGTTWMARCPVHEDRSPSLSISAGNDGKVLVRCHAGCDQRDLIAALLQRGLWQTNGRVSGIAFNHPRRLAEEPDADTLKRRAAALAIWQASQAAQGSPVGTYLRSRGLDLPVSPVLRFHAGLKHPLGGVWSAMVALVTRGATGSPIAVHRTFLTRDGGGKAPVDPAKMMLGPCRGGAVRLGEPGAVLMVGEEIETSGGIQKTPARTPKRNAFPYLGVGNVYRGRLDLRNVKQFELTDGELEHFGLRSGDILIVEGNGSANEMRRGRRDKEAALHLLSLHRLRR